MNKGLLEEFTMADISTELNQMAPFKALGPDSFVACFYQKMVHSSYGGVQCYLSLLSNESYG
jgi:hypothetical protein